MKIEMKSEMKEMKDEMKYSCPLLPCIRKQDILEQPIRL